MEIPIYLEGFFRGRLLYAPEKETLPRLGERLAPLFEPPVAPGRSGLYLASGNAGFQSSLLFWAEAQRSGVAVANPELFPWTLANAPCGWLARHFQVTGPNFTFTGGGEASVAALEQACTHLREKLVDAAWVVGLDFAQRPRGRTTVVAVRLGARPIRAVFTVEKLAEPNRFSAAGALARMVQKT